MMKKILMSVAVATALTLSVSSTFADGITIMSQGIPQALNVACGNIPGLPIQPNSSLPLTWDQIYALFGTNTITCSFSLADNTKVGSALLELNAAHNEGQILKAVANAPYTKAINPAIDGQFHQNITVTLSET